ncbi:MAG TPA: hypothetical protein VJ600_09865, partial [Holophagaceae bacterium]|nr:hypothetical protein [Holophagaceae bacterium]
MVKASLSRLSLAFAGLLLLSGLSCNPKLSGTSDVTINQTQTGGTFGAPGTDFQIAVAQDTIVVPAGGIGTNGLAISWINCAPATISVEIDGLPAGIANAFSVNPTPDLTSVTLTADPTVPAGTYTVRLKGIAGSVLHDTHFSVIVPDPLVPDFSLALAPSSLPITAGGSGSLAITVERIGGFAAPLAFTLDDAPAGVTGTFTTVPLPMKQGAAPAVQTESHSLLINVPAATAPGTYTLHVHATGGGQDHRIGFLVKIAPAADFALNANPASVTVNRTDAFAPPIAVAITRASTFTGAVAFTVSGLPAGVTGTFTPNPTSSTATALNLSLTLPAPGIYPLKITGTSGTLTHSTTVLLTVNPGGPDFQVSAPATTTVDLTGLATGSKTATVPVTLTQLLGFNRPVTLSVTGLPAGVTGTFAPNPATPSAISTLTLTVPASTPPGTRTVTLNADGGSGLVHTTTFQLVIVNPGTFTLSASPNPVNLVLNPAGGATTATSAISLVPANGFASAVTLSASGLPAGVTAAFSPNPTTGTSTLTFTATTPTAVAGTATVTLNGVSGAVGASTTLTLNLLPGADFTLSPASSAVSALPGGTATAAYTVNPLNGFTGTVAFSVSGLPAGVT